MLHLRLPESHEIGSWRVTLFPEGLARVIETDSPRSRTLGIDTFPTPLSQTERAPFNALGFPENTAHSVQNQERTYAFHGLANCMQFRSVSPATLRPVHRFPALPGRA
jgi:hypothetical protein